MLMNRRLYRSRTDTILGGVASGLAQYLNTDPALVRIAWAILVPLTGGAALVAYVVIAGMLEYVFLYDHVRGGVLVLMSLVVFSLGGWFFFRAKPVIIDYV